jgi:hypothetical protein
VEKKLAAIIVSAKLLNCVFPLVPPEITHFEAVENYLYFRLNEIERTYYVALGVPSPEFAPSMNKKNRKKLEEVRQFGANGLEATAKRYQGYVRMIFDWGKEKMQKEFAGRSKEAEKLWSFFQWPFLEVLKYAFFRSRINFFRLCYFVLFS